MSLGSTLTVGLFSLLPHFGYQIKTHVTIQWNEPEMPLRPVVQNGIQRALGLHTNGLSDTRATQCLIDRRKYCRKKKQYHINLCPKWHPNPNAVYPLKTISIFMGGDVHGWLCSWVVVLMGRYVHR